MPARVTNFHRRLLTPTGLQRLRSLGSVSALPVAVVLLLAGAVWDMVDGVIRAVRAQRSAGSRA